MTAFIDTKDVRDILGISNGDRVSFIVEGDTVRIVNSAVYAMQMLQQETKGEAKKAGLETDEDGVRLISEMKNEAESK